MAFTPLSTDFKDEILSEVNTQRKYKQTVNEDGTVSLLDMTAYDQQGSSYSAKDINEEREAINNIYANKLVSLDEIDLVTEEGYFVDAKAVKELNRNIACSPSVKRRETLISFQRNQRYKIEHTGQIQFAAAFSSTQGYCRIYVYNSSGEIVYREQINPAPVPSNEVATGQLAVFEGWEFLAESYNALVAGTPKYTLTY